MTFLVGDVGGTNTRLALADASGLRSETLLRAPNDDHASLLDVIARFQDEQDCAGVDAVCIAIAGPVSQGRGRLTNRNWHICAREVAAQVGAARGMLINDLSALCYALPQLSPTPISGTAPPDNNRQSLVVGMGTGFNVGLTKPGPAGGITVFEAEMGHAELPASVRDTLSASLGTAAAGFTTVEDVFSGLGLARLHEALCGRVLSGPEIMQGYVTGQDRDAAATITLFARGLGQLSRALICQYLPGAGMIFAGSTARGILGSPALDAFAEAYLAPGMEVVRPADIPVSVITDDGAALHGCLHHLMQAG